MPGNTELGALLRELRTARHLTLAAVADQAPCSESLLSLVESGRRRLQPQLATRLDDIYRTDGVIAGLARTTQHPSTVSHPGPGDTLMVNLLDGGVPMPMSRRELLTALGLGVTSAGSLARLDRAIESVSLDDTSQAFENALAGFQSAARSFPPDVLVDELIGRVAILDALRRRCTGARQRRYSAIQARYAESLSWLSEEAADLTAALYWIDRATHWGQLARWPEMSAYCYIRRSMVAISSTNSGPSAIGNAKVVFDLGDASPRMQGLAHKQIAFGHALAGMESESRRSLDRAVDLLSEPLREGDVVLGQRSVLDEDLFTIFAATCDVYLGKGERAVPILLPCLHRLSTSSVRTATITRAKLASAYAQAGYPREAAAFAHTALDDIQRIGSTSARSELLRAMPALHRFSAHPHVRPIIERLNASGGSPPARAPQRNHPRTE